MNFDKIRLTDIQPSEYNPREIQSKEYDKLTKSINEFGFVDPIIINLKNNHIIGGHQRYKVLLDKHSDELDKFKELNIVRLGDIGWVFPNTELTVEDEEHEKALNIALNQQNLMGEWDNDKLKTLFHDLNESEINLDITGFEDFEIDLFLDDEYETFTYQHLIDEKEEEPTEDIIEDEKTTEYEEEEIGGDILSSIEQHNSTAINEPEETPISKIDKLQKQQQSEENETTIEDNSKELNISEKEEDIDYADVVPDDYVDVKGDNANKSYVVSIGFDTHEIANKFLEYLNYHRRMKRDTLQFMFEELHWDIDMLLMEQAEELLSQEEQGILLDEEQGHVWEMPHNKELWSHIK